MTQNDEQIELIMGEDFEKALISAAEVKNNNISICKSRNKDNYAQFYELMLASRVDIQSILDTKKSHRSDDDNNKIKEFKKSTSSSYKQVCDLLVPENLEDGELSKIQKMVQKITNVIKFLDYLGDNRIEEEFKKSGISLSYEHMSETDIFGRDYIKEQMESMFNVGKNNKMDIDKHNEVIKTDIYESLVPIDLQYDKTSNPTGIKVSDFCKLVDLKAQMLQAQNNSEDKEKIIDKATNMAGDYIFQNKRNEILNQKLSEIASEN